MVPPMPGSETLARQQQQYTVGGVSDSDGGGGGLCLQALLLLLQSPQATSEQPASPDATEGLALCRPGARGTGVLPSEEMAGGTFRCHGKT